MRVSVLHRWHTWPTAVCVSVSFTGGIRGQLLCVYVCLAQVAYVANLAGVLQEKEQHQEAEKLLESALQLCKRTLGPQHPMTATVSMRRTASWIAVRLKCATTDPLF